MTEETQPLPQKVIDFLLSEYSNEVQGEGDISTLEAADLWKISRNSASERLAMLVREGKMTKHEGKLKNGHHGTFYRMIS